MTNTAIHARPPAWALLEKAITERKSVRVTYHGHRRVLCPHLLGWHNDRAKLLSYQASGTTSTGALTSDHRHRWRAMFVDEIEDPAITDQPWQTAPNYTPHVIGIDSIELAV